MAAPAKQSRCQDRRVLYAFTVLLPNSDLYFYFLIVVDSDLGPRLIHNRHVGRTHYPSPTRPIDTGCYPSSSACR